MIIHETKRGFRARQCRTSVAIASVIAAAILPACGSGGGGSGSVAESQVAQINGNLLATIDNGAGHHVDFYDFGFGLRGVSETRGMADPEWVVASPNANSPSEIYRLMRPNEEVPQAIVAADARGVIDSARLAAASPGTPATEVVEPPPNWVPPVAPGAAKAASADAETALSQISEASLVCSTDELNDNWGEVWFKGMFNNNAMFPCPHTYSSIIQLSLPASVVTIHAGQDIEYNQFEADFLNAGITSGSWKDPMGPRNFLWRNVSLPPRHAMTWHLFGGAASQSYELDGVSPCSHDDYSLVFCRPS
jgi:hypothetical protein